MVQQARLQLILRGRVGTVKRADYDRPHPRGQDSSPPLAPEVGCMCLRRRCAQPWPRECARSAEPEGSWGWKARTDCGWWWESVSISKRAASDRARPAGASRGTGPPEANHSRRASGARAHSVGFGAPAKREKQTRLSKPLQLVAAVVAWGARRAPPALEGHTMVVGSPSANTKNPLRLQSQRAEPA